MTNRELMTWLLGVSCLAAVLVSLGNTMAAVSTAAQAARVEQASQMVDGPYRRYYYGGKRAVKGDTLVVIRVAYLPLVGDQTKWRYDRIYCPLRAVVLTPSMEPGDAIRGTTARCSYHLSDFER